MIRSTSSSQLPSGYGVACASVSVRLGGTGTCSTSESPPWPPPACRPGVVRLAGDAAAGAAAGDAALAATGAVLAGDTVADVGVVPLLFTLVGASSVRARLDAGDAAAEALALLSCLASYSLISSSQLQSSSGVLGGHGEVKTLCFSRQPLDA